MVRLYEGVSGASETKALIDADVMNKIITDILVENVQLCDKNSTITQNINTCPSSSNINVPAGIRQKAALVIAQACAQDTEATNKIANDIANKVEAEAAAKTASGAGLLVNGATSNYSDIKTKVHSDIQTTMKNITKQSCNVITGVSQNVSLCGNNINIRNIDQGIDIAISGGCDQISRQFNDLSNQLATDIKQTATSGTDLMAGIIAIVFLFVVLGIIGAVIYATTSDDSKDKFFKQLTRRRQGRAEPPAPPPVEGAMELKYDW